MTSTNVVPGLATIAGKGKVAIFGLVIVISTFMAAFHSMYTVDEGHVGIIKRFGEATEQVNPGLHIKMPFVDTVEILEIRTRKNLEKLNASTHEQMPVTAEVSINWTVIRDQAFDLFKRYGGLGQFESRILDPKLRSAAKATADGKTYAIEAEAVAEAEAIKLKGLAEAEAIKKKAEALKESPLLVEYVRAQRWNGQMPKEIMGEGQNVLWNMA